MLKVKSLNMIDGLTVEEKMAPGQVVVTVKDAEIKGTAHFKRDGMNLVASVLAGGNIEEQKGFTPADVTVKVTKKLVRDIEIAKGDAEVDLADHLSEAILDKIVADSVKLDGKAVTVTSNKITLDPAATKDKVAKLELVATVAEGTAEDSNLASVDTLDADAGPIHFSMICEVEHHPCSKHSKTRCSVRGRKPWKVTGEDAPIRLSPLP